MIRVTLYSGATRDVFEYNEDEEVSFGRSPNNTIVLNANYVSRHHGKLVCEDGSWFVVDNKSKMGMTLIRGRDREVVQDRQKEQRRQIEGSETIQILNTLMRVEVDPSAPSPDLRKPSEDSSVAPAAVTQMSDLDTLQQALTSEGQKLAPLLDLAKDLNRLYDLDEVLERIARTVFEALPSATYYAVCVHDPVSDAYVPRLGMLKSGQRLKGDEVTISRSIIDLVLKQEMAMLFQSPDEQIASSKSIMMNRIWSSMAVPLRGSGGFVGVMQVDNRSTKAPFAKPDLDLLMVLANSAAFALERAKLQSDIQRMFDGFVDASVLAIEARDPTTSGHSRRVARYSTLLGDAANREEAGPLAATHFSERQLREIQYAGLLHDFGKVGVREQVLVKAHRLYPEDMLNIEHRFKYVRATYVSSLLARALTGEDDGPSGMEAVRWIEGKATHFNRRLHEILDFVRKTNRAGFVTDEQIERLRRIAAMSYTDEDGEQRSFLEEAEVSKLAIRRGTLTNDERREIETHVSYTFRFLQQIPWSGDLRGIADIVHSHHEKLDGSGYPRGLRAKDIPPQARMLTVCDIYDAVTAADRPYRSALPAERGLDILWDEARGGKIDEHFVDLFVRSGAWKKGAQGDGTQPITTFGTKKQRDAS